MHVVAAVVTNIRPYWSFSKNVRGFFSPFRVSHRHGALLPQYYERTRNESSSSSSSPLSPIFDPIYSLSLERDLHPISTTQSRPKVIKSVRSILVDDDINWSHWFSALKEPSVTWKRSRKAEIRAFLISWAESFSSAPLPRAYLAT